MLTSRHTLTTHYSSICWRVVTHWFVDESSRIDDSWQQRMTDESSHSDDSEQRKLVMSHHTLTTRPIFVILIDIYTYLPTFIYILLIDCYFYYLYIYYLFTTIILFYFYFLITFNYSIQKLFLFQGTCPFQSHLFITLSTLYLTHLHT